MVEQPSDTGPQWTSNNGKVPDSFKSYGGAALDSEFCPVACTAVRSAVSTICVSGFDSQIWHDQLGGSKQMTWNSSSTHPRMAVTVKSCLPGRFSHR